MSCKMCGQCCRNINMPLGTYEMLRQRSNNRSIDPKTKRLVSDDIYFIKRHWKYLGTSKQVGGFLIDGEEFEVFCCEFVTDDNLCSIHKNRPRVCSGYPYYGKSKFGGGSTPWSYEGCGYNMDTQLIFLREVLIKIVDQKRGENNEN